MTYASAYEVFVETTIDVEIFVIITNLNDLASRHMIRGQFIELHETGVRGIVYMRFIGREPDGESHVASGDDACDAERFKLACDQFDARVLAKKLSEGGTT